MTGSVHGRSRSPDACSRVVNFRFGGGSRATVGVVRRTTAGYEHLAIAEQSDAEFGTSLKHGAGFGECSSRGVIDFRIFDGGAQAVVDTTAYHQH